MVEVCIAVGSRENTLTTANSTNTGVDVTPYRLNSKNSTYHTTYLSEANDIHSFKLRGQQTLFKLSREAVRNHDKKCNDYKC